MLGRSSVARQAAESTDEGDMPPQQESHDQVRNALGSMPENVRAVVILRVIEGLPGTEVATLLGISEATTSRRLGEGLEMLTSVLTRGRARSMAGGD